MQFRDGCLEGTSGINTSTSNASLCIIQTLKLCPSLPFQILLPEDGLGGQQGHLPTQTGSLWIHPNASLTYVSVS